LGAREQQQGEEDSVGMLWDFRSLRALEHLADLEDLPSTGHDAEELILLDSDSFHEVYSEGMWKRFGPPGAMGELSDAVRAAYQKQPDRADTGSESKARFSLMFRDILVLVVAGGAGRLDVMLPEEENQIRQIEEQALTDPERQVFSAGLRARFEPLGAMGELSDAVRAAYQKKPAEASGWSESRSRFSLEFRGTIVLVSTNGNGGLTVRLPEEPQDSDSSLPF
jgi:hypothetical protein